MDRLLLNARVDTEIPPEWFHAGQFAIWCSTHDIVLALCGRQAGKTVTGPWWLLREIQRRGPGDYLVGGPSLELLGKKVVKEFRTVFKEYGSLSAKPWVFNFSAEGLHKLFGRSDEPCVVFFGHGDDPDSMESMTLKGAWVDECGQKRFKKESYEALTGRLAIHKGRLLLTTTPYEWGWLKHEIYDPWLAKEANHIDVHNFESTMNPTFPVDRFDREEARLPKWRFDMMYRGKFTKPAGMIYDCFDRETHTVPRFEIPEDWRITSGHDFGPVNTAAVFAAKNPKTGIIYIYRAYHSGGKEPGAHAKQFTSRAFGTAPMAWGGAPSEDKTRRDYAVAGYPIQLPPVKDVIEGITRVYSLLKIGALVIFDDLDKLLAEIETYSWEVDERGEPIEGKIQDKATFHRLDALRYLCSALYEGMGDEFKVADRFESEHTDTEDENPETNAFAHLGWE